MCSAGEAYTCVCMCVWSCGVCVCVCVRWHVRISHLSSLLFISSLCSLVISFFPLHSFHPPHLHTHTHTFTHVHTYTHSPTYTHATLTHSNTHVYTYTPHIQTKHVVYVCACVCVVWVFVHITHIHALTGTHTHTRGARANVGKTEGGGGDTQKTVSCDGNGPRFGFGAFFGEQKRYRLIFIVGHLCFFLSLSLSRSSCITSHPTSLSLSLSHSFHFSLPLWHFTIEQGQGRMSASEVFRLFRQLVNAVYYCHNLEVTHSS